MKKLSKIIMSMVMVTVLLGITAITAGAAGTNLMPSTAGTFESTDIPTGWTKVGSTTTLSLSTEEKHGGQKSLVLEDRSEKYHSPAYKIYSVFKENGAGTYSISMWVYADGLSDPADVLMRMRCADDTPSFIDEGKTYATIGQNAISDTEWLEITGTVTITDGDITAATDDNMTVCLDAIAGDATVYIDDVTITKDGDTGSDATNAPSATGTSSNNGDEQTGDLMTVGYAAAAITSLGALVAARRKQRK